MKPGGLRESQRLSIPGPCTASDEHFSPAAGGRHCALCDHVVVDASAMTEGQLLALHARSGQVCIVARADSETGRLLVKKESPAIARRRLPLLGALGAAALVACAPEPAPPPRAPQDVSNALRPDEPYALPMLPPPPARSRPSAPKPAPTPSPTAGGKRGDPALDDDVHVKGKMVVDPEKQKQREQSL